MYLIYFFFPKEFYINFLIFQATQRNFILNFKLNNCITL